jgi:hypothetical protein
VDNRRVTEVLSRRALNRATLARQLLLQRAAVAPVEAVHHLVGLQAQVPQNPYTALWSRLEGFEPASLSRLLEERAVVRVGVMRGTIHLVTAGDCLLLRPLVQPVFEGQLWRHRDYSPELRDLELEPIVAFGRSLLDERPRTGTELRALFAERFPDLSAAALVYACQMRLALVQPPPRGLWRRGAKVAWTTAEAWLGRPLDGSPTLDDVVLRYFAAFGPASVADVTTWSRLTGLRSVVERLRPRLVAFRDERGRELFDLPDAPRPDPGVPAPVRFLPEFDNVLLAYAGFDRVMDPAHKRTIFTVNGRILGTVLVAGFAAATWRVDTGKGRATLTVTPLTAIAARDRRSVAAEGARLLAFLEPDAEGEVVVR